VSKPLRQRHDLEWRKGCFYVLGGYAIGVASMGNMILAVVALLGAMWTVLTIWRRYGNGD
jgi:hypothetical protein